MDAFNFLKNRQLNPESVFSNDQPMIENEEDFSALLKTLDGLLEKQIKTWWDVFTFEHYRRENLIFRSLRWEVPPQDGFNDQSFMNEWLEFFNKAGRELQGLVLKRKQIKLSMLNEKIRDLQEKLEPIKDTNQMNEFNNNIKKKLEKIDRETQKKKVKKFNRDLNDFKTNKIYAWQASLVSNTEDPAANTSAAGGTSNPPKGDNKKKAANKSKVSHAGMNPRSSERGRSVEAGQYGRDYYRSPRPSSRGRGGVRYHQSPRPLSRGRGGYPRGQYNEYSSPRGYRGNTPQGYGEWQRYPPQQHYQEGYNNVPLYNRFSPLEREDRLDYSPFLGQRGRGGGTPKRNPRGPYQRGGGRQVPPQDYHMPPRGEEGGVGREDPGNPRKRPRDVET